MANLDLSLTKTRHGIVVPLKVSAASRTDAIRGIKHGRLKVSVTAVAEKGKANQAIISLLAKKLGLPKRQLVIVGGLTSSDKKLLVTELELNDLLVKIRGCLE
jgi:uncharacterized protein (TIGR00251 family)